MKAGPKLDALIAEKVMGWRLVKVEEWEPADPNTCRWHLDDGWAWDGRDGSDYAWKWKPSTDISLAWQVVEKLAEKADRYVAVRHDRWYDKHPYLVEIHDPLMRNSFPKIVQYGETAPLAICLAALRIENDNM